MSCFSDVFYRLWYARGLARFRATVLLMLLRHNIGRRFLAFLVTIYARQRTGTDVKVFFDEVWGHSLAGLRIPDSRRFCYFGEMVDHWSGEVEEWRRSAEQCWCLVYKPQPGDTIIDVGAGIGTDAFYFSPKVGDKGRIIAIEANPNTYNLLTRLCEWNGLRNVVCRQCAIVDKPGELKIEDSDYHEANSLTSEFSAPQKVVTVPGFRLDDLIEQDGLSNIDLIKMNIEGAEVLAVEGMMNALARARYVCIACHDFRADRGEGERFRTRKKIEKILREHGFKLLMRDQGTVCSVRDHVHAFREH